MYRLTWEEMRTKSSGAEDDEEEESRDISETGKGAKANVGQGLGRVTQRPRLR